MRLSRFFAVSLASAGLAVGCTSGVKQGAAVPSPTPVAADDTVGHVRALLSTYEEVPGKDAWLKMEGDVPKALEQVATDTSERPSRRARACEVLGWFGDRGLPTLRAVLADETLDGSVRMGAVTGLARALPSAEAVPVVVRTLADKEPMVRFRSVLELKRLGGPEARAALAARQGVETDPSVDRALKQALQQMPPSATVPAGTTPSTGTP